MLRHLLVAILLLALVGLVYVQFRLLLTGVRLEKQRFDQRANDALAAVSDSLDRPGRTADLLVEHLRIGSAVGDPLTTHPLSDSLDALFRRALRREGVRGASFAFAITPRNGTEVLVANSGYRPFEFAFGRYTTPLGPHIIARCHYEPILHFDVPNLFGYLLGQLRNLAIPSVLCLLAIALSLVLLLQVLRRERRLNAVKNDFINHLAHELKTPAFSISLSAKMALENIAEGNPQKAAKLLQLIENENDRIKSHAEKVLELGSLESPGHTLRRSPEDPHRLIREVAAGYMEQAGARGGSLALHLADLSLWEGGPPTVPLDPAHFGNAVANLLDNALKYSPGAPQVTVYTAFDRRHFRVSVADRGEGIEPAFLKKVFEKFYRIPGSRAKGFGLGLGYVRQVARAHGGRAWAEGRPGGGSVFVVEVPLG
jgi:two-component system phosphate regulon sensor histidine kinase PhoR